MLVIKNGLILTVNEQSDVFRGDLLIEDSKIVKIAHRIDEAKAEIFDASDYIVMPGFVQTHIHLCQTLFRNMADDLNLLDWLKKKIWPLEGAHTEDTLRTSAQLGLVELLLGGTSTIMDMGTVHHMHVVFEEIEKSGIRAYCGKTMMDNGETPDSLLESTDDALETSLNLMQNWHNKANGRIKYAFAPRFILSCSEDLLKEVFTVCQKEDLIFHSHAAENTDEVRLVVESTGTRNISAFEKLGIVGPNVCLAHCIWLDRSEKDILEDNQIKVLHCPSANLKLGSGIAPVPEYLKRGISVSLGADGAPCNNNLNMFNEMRLAALIQKPIHGPTCMDSETVFRMATIEGARALGIGDQIGSIEEEKKADLAFCKINQFDTIPFENIYSKVVYSTNSSGIDHLMIDGQWAMRNRQPVNYNIDTIVSEANIKIQSFKN